MHQAGRLGTFPNIGLQISDKFDLFSCFEVVYRLLVGDILGWAPYVFLGKTVIFLLFFRSKKVTFLALKKGHFFDKTGQIPGFSKCGLGRGLYVYSPRTPNIGQFQGFTPFP